MTAEEEALWEDLRDRFDQLDLPQSHRDLLDERRARVKEGSARLLDWDTAIPLLIDGLRERNPPSQFRYAAETLLPSIGLGAESLVAEALYDENPLVVETAAKALRKIGSAAARAALEAHTRQRV